MSFYLAAENYSSQVVKKLGGAYVFVFSSTVCGVSVIGNLPVIP